MKRWIGFLVCLFLAAVVAVPPCFAEETPAMVVGRIYYIEGELLRYVLRRRTGCPCQGCSLRYGGYTLFRKPWDGGADRPQRELDQDWEQHTDPVHHP